VAIQCLGDDLLSLARARDIRSRIPVWYSTVEGERQTKRLEQHVTRRLLNHRHDRPRGASKAPPSLNLRESTSARFGQPSIFTYSSTAYLTLGCRSFWRVNPPLGEWRDLVGGSQEALPVNAIDNFTSGQLQSRRGPACRHGASSHEPKSEIRRVADRLRKVPTVLGPDDDDVYLSRPRKVLEQ
jgi:hypothetical protein